MRRPPSPRRPIPAPARRSVGPALAALLALSPTPFAARGAADVPPPIVAHDLSDRWVARALGPSSPRPGGEARFLVQVLRPWEGLPVAGAAVEARLELWPLSVELDDPLPMNASGTTDARGDLELVFPLPDLRATSFWDWDLEAEVRVGDTTRTLELDGFFDSDVEVVISSDRLLYRPGETVRARALVRSIGKGGPLAGFATTVELRDPRDRTVSRRELVADRHGVVAWEWELPATVAEGRFFLVVGDFLASATLEVRAWEAPRLLVEARADRPAVLPGGTATIRIRVTHPDGSPAEGALARVPTNSEVAPVGDPAIVLDADGAGTLEVDLAPVHEDLDGDWLSFRDVEVPIEVEDPVTGRVEGRTVDLRATLEPVHVRLVGSPGPPGSAPRWWAVTTTAEGEPITCDVEVVDGLGNGWARGRTGRLGVTRLDLRGPPVRAGLAAKTIATCVDGSRGSRTRWFPSDLEAWPEVRLEPAAPILTPGEDLVLVVETTRRIDRVEVEVLRRGRVVARRLLHGVEGRRRVVVPRSEDWSGVLEITATDVVFEPTDLVEEHRPAHDLALVLAVGPPAPELALHVDPLPARPGAPARIHLALAPAAGPPATGVALLAATDATLEEKQDELGLGPAPGALAGLRLDRAVIGDLTLDGLTARFAVEPEAAADPDLRLVTEVLLEAETSWWARSGQRSALTPALGSWSGAVRRWGKTVEALLARAEPSFPDRDGPGRDPQRVFAAIRNAATHPAELADPWGHEVRFGIERDPTAWRVTVRSVGPDGRLGTFDDLTTAGVTWAWARDVETALETVVPTLVLREERFPRTLDDLRGPLAAAGLAPEELLDPTGRPWRVRGRAFGSQWRVELFGNATEVGDTRPERDRDRAAPQEPWSTAGNPRVEPALRFAAADAAWGATLQVELLAAIRRAGAAGGSRPSGETSDALQAQVAAAHEVVADRRDPWGLPLEIETSSRRTRIPEVWRQAGIAPRRLDLVARSRGADATAGTADDLEVARVALGRDDVRRLASGGGAGPPPHRAIVSGRVEDAEGRPLPGSTVTLTPASPDHRAGTTVADAHGRFAAVVEPGTWGVMAELEGFEPTATAVDLGPEEIERIVLVLEPTAIEEAITVTSEGVLEEIAPLGRRPRAGTPRLRRDFPETLLWLPVLELADGRATVEATLADTVTTWRLAALASTNDGALGTAQLDLVATLPFHAEPDLPSTATAGDRIEVPIGLHNGSGVARRVRVSGRVDGAPHPVEAPPVEVADGSVARASLPIDLPRAGTIPVRFDADGISTPAESAAPRGVAETPVSDSVEKTVAVAFPGRPTVRSVAWLLADGGSDATLEVPTDAVPGSSTLELVVLPDPGAWLRRSLERLAILPGGCTEQVISRAWPSLLLLERGGLEPVEEEKLVGHLRSAREHLADVGSPRGLPYFHRGRPDAALSALGIELLRRAGRFLEPEREEPDPLVEPLARFLLDAAFEGGWDREPWSWSAPSPRAPDPRVTGFVAMALARLASEPGLREPDPSSVREAVDRALDYLGRPTPRWPQAPYVLATQALAAAARGDVPTARAAAAPLRAALADAGPEGALLSPLDGTPFWGWGRAGRIETTSLALAALAALGPPDETPTADPTVAAALPALLTAIDGSGIWGSTQATARALDALVAALPPGTIRVGGHGDPAPTVTVGGAPVDLVSSGPDLPWRSALRPLPSGDHRLRIEAHGPVSRDAPPVLVQAILRHHEPWTEPPDRGVPSGLAFAVECAPTAPAPGEPVRCTVEAARTDLRRGGMLIAEIGLPPGAVVDRAGLDAAVSERGSGLARWELRPDRIVAYLWSGDQPARFELRWRPRLAIDALAAPSRLVDSYAPEAEVWLEPDRFTVRAPAARDDRHPGPGRSAASSPPSTAVASPGASGRAPTPSGPGAR